ncbi:MAG: FAD-dependent oxidoreductase [Dehalococcoidia bacterium]|nr:MAG: FAD-dependent oxidoreductase [Dehalococcoidia bacterium]
MSIDLFEPYRIGKLELKNRFMRSATWDGEAVDETGAVTDDSVALYRELGRGGVGLIVGGHAFISTIGRTDPRQYGINTDDMIPGLRRMAQAAHEGGAKIVLQINHTGGYTDYLADDVVRQAVSKTDRISSPHREMTEEEIEVIISDFASAAVRAREAGFDGIQLHGAHCYLMSQVLSPLYNKRTDRWGGSAENRRRFHLEVIRRVSQAVGTDFPILIKFGVQDDEEGGLSLSESLPTAQKMEEAGIAAIEVSKGMSAESTFVRRVKKGAPEQAYFRHLAAAVKRAVTVPVAAVGGIRSLQMAQSIVDSGDADLISMSRPYIHEPGFVNRWQRGGGEPVNTCTSCTTCLYEAEKCKLLQCWQAPCRAACPAGVDAEGYIALISESKFKEALELVRRTMPFAGVCGRVCNHPCQNDCERSTVDEPIAIASLHRFIADYELKSSPGKVPPVPQTKEAKVAIVGSGPAGLACAYDLVREGYAVTVFETMLKAGGLLRYGIPEYRLPKSMLDREIDYIKETGVEIKTSTPVGDIGKLFERGYEAVFLATGAANSQKMNISGEDTPGVMHALDFLQQVNSGTKVKLGERVGIIGGSNAALDAARVAWRLGAKEISIIYRRSRAEMPAIASEVEGAELEGVKFLFLTTPQRVLAKNNRVTGAECIHMELGEPDASGRRRPIPIKGSEFSIRLDNIIFAVGQVVDKDKLPEKLEYAAAGTVSVDPVTLGTSITGVFAGGDVVAGPGGVIESIAAGKEAAISIDRYLCGMDLTTDRPKAIKRVEDISKEGVTPQPGVKMPLLRLKQRKGSFAEVELGFDETAAIAEANRCLFCTLGGIRK